MRVGRKPRLLNLSDGVTGTAVGLVSVGIKCGSQRVHVLATSALGTSWEGGFRLFTMVGMGGHFPLDTEERYSLDTDVSHGTWQRNFFGEAPSTHLYRLRVTAAWEMRRRFALFAGLTVNRFDAPARTRTGRQLPVAVRRRLGPALARRHPGRPYLSPFKRSDSPLGNEGRVPREMGFTPGKPWSHLDAEQVEHGTPEVQCLPMCGRGARPAHLRLSGGTSRG
ncbi:hypothetical protein BHS09_08635 [Myxococcus xanthus]|uniref:Uncharacterized protein n=1 Tax=Myxococcus xanthus TaxID=34 RepID=A0AAE6FX99_MYXXA|nr:hypothetical protein BHS09_08635 [Myxococcus xanthus]QDE74344.1 hypothetical protein BHS08_08645 [Myxococcus xanthus]